MTDSDEILARLNACIARIDGLDARLSVLDRRAAALPALPDESEFEQLHLVPPIAPGDELPTWLSEVEPGALYDAIYLAVEIGAEVLDDELYQRAQRVQHEVNRAQRLTRARQEALRQQVDGARADRGAGFRRARAGIGAYQTIAADTAPEPDDQAPGRERVALSQEIRDRVAQLHRDKS